jgi:hypothetical protein
VPTLTYSPALGSFASPPEPVASERSIRISPQTCSAVVLALNAYQGAFTRTHLERLRQRDRDATASRELAPLIAAVENQGAVHVSFAATSSRHPDRG